MERRHFLTTIPALAALSSFKNIKSELPISCNTYNWVTFYRREGKVWGADVSSDIKEFVKCGITAIEPNIESLEMGRALLPILKANDIEMPSIYVNSVLHEEVEVKKSIDLILAIARLVKPFGTKILVTNPSPIKWGSTEIKTDAQLMTQAAALNRLGQLLREIGITLAYHTHDMEMLAGAREFHHMLQNTEPKNMSFCFDLHWIYRGSTNSELAVFDVLKMYGDRIAELHLRQSKQGIWQETFTADGDIDYQRVADELAKRDIRPHLVIEQCIEKDTPEKLDAITAHQADFKEVRRVFER
jgi:inosose dehydratase